MKASRIFIAASTLLLLACNQLPSTSATESAPARFNLDFCSADDVVAETATMEAGAGGTSAGFDAFSSRMRQYAIEVFGWQATRMQTMDLTNPHTLAANFSASCGSGFENRDGDIIKAVNDISFADNRAQTRRDFASDTVIVGTQCGINAKYYDKTTQNVFGMLNRLCSTPDLKSDPQLALDPMLTAGYFIQNSDSSIITHDKAAYCAFRKNYQYKQDRWEVLREMRPTVEMAASMVGAFIATGVAEVPPAQANLGLFFTFLGLHFYEWRQIQLAKATAMSVCEKTQLAGDNEFALQMLTYDVIGQVIGSILNAVVPAVGKGIGSYLRSYTPNLYGGTIKLFSKEIQIANVREFIELAKTNMGMLSEKVEAMGLPAVEEGEAKAFFEDLEEGTEKILGPRVIPEDFSGLPKVSTDAAKKALNTMADLEYKFRLAVSESGAIGRDARDMGESLAAMYEVDGRLMEAAWVWKTLGEELNATGLTRRVEQILSTGDYSSPIPLGGGVTQTVLVKFESGVYGVFKPMQQTGRGAWAAHFQHEVAAYLVDKKLGLGLVPVTVERTMGGVRGSLQYFIRDARNGGARTDMMNMLDYLIANEDRHTGNFMTRAGSETVAIDHGITFGVKGGHAQNFTPKYWRLPLRVVQALRSITPEQWQTDIAPLLRDSWQTLQAAAKDKKEASTLKDLLAGTADTQFNNFLKRVESLKAQLL